jgi:hypothetical protein
MENLSENDIYQFSYYKDREEGELPKRIVSGVMLTLLLTVLLASVSIIFSGAVRGQEEEWFPYVPDASHTELSYWEENGISYMNCSIVFADSGHMVSNWGTPNIDANNISVDAEIWRYEGVSLPVVIIGRHSYTLGRLLAGEYLFIFKAWESPVKNITFTVTKPVGGYSFMIEGPPTTKPLTPYLAIIAILTISFTAIKRKRTGKTK